MDSQYSTNNEPDDFEFKPLTDGLGFHQKKTDQNFNLRAKPLVSFDNQLPDLSEVTSPLPRKNKNLKSPVEANENSTVDEILKTIQSKKNLDFVNEKQNLTITSESTPKFKPSTWNLSAGLLDTMLITAATLFCLILLLSITHVDLFANLYNPDPEGTVYISLFLLVGSISWIYLVTNRIFLGFTPGEWVFDQRLGLPNDQQTNSFALKTVLRSTLVFITGFFVFPLVSLALGEDFLGKITGLKLMQKTY